MKEKNNKYTFEYDNIRFVLSDPEIQAHKSIMFINSVDDILYYYYTLEVFKKKKKKWKRICISDAYDFPQILLISKMLKDIQEDDFEGWQCQELKSRDCNYTFLTKTYMPNSLAAEDQYLVTRNVIFDTDTKEKLSENYAIFIGGTNDIVSNSLPGVMFNGLRKKDVQKFSKFIDTFIQESINQHNMHNVMMLEEKGKRMKIKEGKLYEYKDVNNTEIESIYAPGDSLEFNLLKEEDNRRFYHDYHNCTLKEAKDGYITVSGGYYNDRSDNVTKIGEDGIRVPVDKIFYIFNNISNSPKLAYNEDECYEDFIELLSDSELEEFKTKPEDELIRRWKDAIIDRAWMCRKEHHFSKPVDEVVCDIVKKIKKLGKNKQNG